MITRRADSTGPFITWSVISADGKELAHHTCATNIAPMRMQSDGQTLKDRSLTEKQRRKSAVSPDFMYYCSHFIHYNVGWSVCLCSCQSTRSIMKIHDIFCDENTCQT